MKRTLALAAAFLGCILAANWVVGHVGTQYQPGGPHVLPVWLGISAPSAVYVVGVTMVVRDLLQRQVGKRGKEVTFALILVGAALSAVLAPAVAIASGAAFLASETADLAVFTATERRAGFLPAVLASNAVGLVVDSVAFLWLAFGSLNFLEGQIIGKALATIAAVGAIWGIRRHEAAAA